MTILIAILAACATNGDTTSYTSTEPRIAIQNDASEIVTVSVLASDGTLEVWFDDVASGTATDWESFDADDLDGAQILVHAGPALAGVLDLDYGNNTIVLSDDAEPELEIGSASSDGSGSDGGSGGNGGTSGGSSGWGW